jgi:hypothetical protein
MMLSSIVLSRDWPEICVLECILGGLDFAVDVESEPLRVQGKLAKSKIDALIVDCAVEGSAELIRGLRRDQNTVPLLLFGNRGDFQARASEGTFLSAKPISVERAVHALSAARSSILEGRLRYHRHLLDVTVSIGHGHHRAKAELQNLSQGGVAIRTTSAMCLPDRVQIDFTLPRGLHIKVEGELVWKQPEAAGFRFVEMTPGKRRDLEVWLAQRYLSRQGCPTIAVRRSEL